MENSDSRELRPRIKAALEYLNHCRFVTQPFFDSDVRDRARDLTKLEQAAYNSAVSMLTRYFTGEIDLGDTPMCGSDSEPVVRKKNKQQKVKQNK